MNSSKPCSVFLSHAWKGVSGFASICGGVAFLGLTGFGVGLTLAFVGLVAAFGGGVLLVVNSELRE